MCTTSCKGICEINRENISFVDLRLVRYNLGMKACKVCEKSWKTKSRFCHCCKNKLRGKKRDKNDRYIRVAFRGLI